MASAPEASDYRRVFQVFCSRQKESGGGRVKSCFIVVFMVRKATENFTDRSHRCTNTNFNDLPCHHLLQESH